MLDRTIPFRNTILRCDQYSPQAPVLPEGFSVVPYQPGDERAWAALECSIGDFASAGEAEQYFVSTYLKDRGLQNNLLFLRNAENRAVGSAIAWRDPRGDAAVSSLHWLVVEESCQGRGLGKALCCAAMNRFCEQGALPVYVHTQPWSWKAILLYVSLGFRLQREDSFSHYENEYAAAMAALKAILPADRYEALLAASE